MNLESGKVIIDSYRVIGIKDSDKEKLIEAANRKESSFETPSVSEPMIQDQPIVEVVPEIMPEAQEVTPVTPIEPTFVQPVEPVVQESVSVPENNMFDIPVQEPVAPVMPEIPVMENPTVNPVEPIIPNQLDEVQGGVTNNMSTELDTPQNFFEKVEQPANETVLTQEMVESNRETYGDPAIIMLDNVKDIVESKNEMIKALNEKINVLTEQVKNLEEARKVSEAQRVAAETTLANARSAEVNGGPTLTYSNPAYPSTNQNVDQAA